MEMKGRHWRRKKRAREKGRGKMEQQQPVRCAAGPRVCFGKNQERGQGRKGGMQVGSETAGSQWATGRCHAPPTCADATQSVAGPGGAAGGCAFPRRPWPVGFAHTPPQHQQMSATPLRTRAFEVVCEGQADAAADRRAALVRVRAVGQAPARIERRSLRGAVARTGAAHKDGGGGLRRRHAQRRHAVAARARRAVARV